MSVANISSNSPTLEQNLSAEALQSDHLLAIGALTLRNALDPLLTFQADQIAETTELRNGEYVKNAPNFLEQIADTSRINLVHYVPNQKAARGTHLDQSKAVSLTEHDALQGLYDFLSQTATLKDGGKPAIKATSMLEGLTFIGEREYNEATAAIAEDWKGQLTVDKQLQICAIAGKIRSGVMKSDSYTLDKILGNFSDEELQAFKGRLVLEPSELEAGNESLRLLLIDDWTSSGMQLRDAGSSVLAAYPKYADRLSVQLIAASKERLETGILANTSRGDEMVLPVNTYFVANDAPDAQAHITGAHSSLDYGFENEMGNMVYQLSKSRGDDETNLPPLTNVARPYKRPGYQTKNIKRLRTV
ncbi:hypothetical protein H7171_02980 [Candidatus Saccharibacteria bacterium]|nr:hypothetical protein [Candidatus Saccharibacteria bacterium]